MHPCRHPSCKALLKRSGYCDAHKHHDKSGAKLYDTRVRAMTPHLMAARDFRSSYKWKRVSKMKLSLNPICEDPYKEHARRQLTETAKQVHHIVGLKECANDERAYSLDNLMSVCTRCHARLERDELLKTLQEGNNSTFQK